MVKRICIERGVQPQHTYIDSGFEAGRIYDICRRFGWIAIKGDGVRSYKHPVAGGRTEERLMSTVKSVPPPSGGRRVPLVHLAVDPLKDILARLRSGEGARWQVPEDIGDDWTSQIDSEERQEFIHPKTKQPTTKWIRRKRANHAWDVEVYQVAAAIIKRVF